MVSQAFAQGAAAAPQVGAPSLFAAFFPFILIMVLFYFLLILPQNKERKKREQMLAGIERGDRVLLRGGVYGTVADIRGNILLVKIAENTKVEVSRAYVDVVEKPGGKSD